MMIHGWAAHSAGAALVPHEYEAPPLGPGDVEVQISHCGICHTDVHLLNDDWGITAFPTVAGHEIVGVVTAVGQDVRHLREGERVGAGYQSGSCGICEMCRASQENLCPQMKGTCVNGFGAYADYVSLDGRFAVPIPDKLEAAAVSPLLCGGITVYSPFEAFDIKPGMRVGVIGIGGLGHMALQFARARGYEVTAFSNSPSKSAEARRFGAHEFVTLDDAQSGVIQMTGHYDFILNTAPNDLDWDFWISALKPRGRLCIVGVPNSKVSFSAFPVILGQKSISGSPIGSPDQIRRMLDFAAAGNITAQVEVVPMAKVNEALGKVVRNEARYRMVLSN